MIRRPEFWLIILVLNSTLPEANISQTVRSIHLKSMLLARQLDLLSFWPGFDADCSFSSFSAFRQQGSEQGCGRTRAKGA
jgi:hypothetical protein